MSATFTYEPFYGLDEKPFSLSPDPRFLFRSPAHGPTFDEIQAGIRRREGLIILTGEIGTGKTTLCRAVLQHLDRRTFAAFVADPFVSREDLLKKLLVDFGVVSIGDLTRGRFSGASRTDLSYPLYEFLDSLAPLQAFAVVVIDEAQNLSVPLLEEIRILSELEQREKLLQMVLIGQPELRSKLKLPEMRQVDQRVSVRSELAALDAAAVAGYVRHRLDVAGRGQGRVAFTQPALQAIHRGSSGVPRLINRICDRALQRGFASSITQIDADLVRTAIDDLGLATAAAVQDRKPRTTPAATASSPSSPAVGAAPARSVATVTPADVSAASKRPAVLLTERPAIEKPRSGSRWIPAVAAVVLTVSASIGGAAWYSRAQDVDGREVVAMAPPAPAPALSQLAVLPSYVEPSSPSSAPAHDAAGSPAAVPASASTVSRAESRYSILIASFQNRVRAERLVEELVNDGLGAHTVDREGGPTGRLVQVRISGYTSAIDVQRDLQRVRELPGGYSDAQIVAHE